LEREKSLKVHGEGETSHKRLMIHIKPVDTVSKCDIHRD